jgi:hypothetical protein
VALTSGALGLLFLLVIFALLGLAFGWLRFGTPVIVLVAVALWVYAYLSKGGDLTGDGDVAVGWWVVLAGISVVGALLGGAMARSARLWFRDRGSSPE